MKKLGCNDVWDQYQFKARNLDCKQTNLPSPLESSTLYWGAASVSELINYSALIYVFIGN